MSAGAFVRSGRRGKSPVDGGFDRESRRDSRSRRGSGSRPRQDALVHRLKARELPFDALEARLAGRPSRQRRGVGSSSGRRGRALRFAMVGETEGGTAWWGPMILLPEALALLGAYWSAASKARRRRHADGLGGDLPIPPGLSRIGRVRNCVGPAPPSRSSRSGRQLHRLE